MKKLLIALIGLVMVFGFNISLSYAGMPPVAEAGSNQVLYENDPTGIVTLDGSASYDPEGKPLGYSWRQIPEEPMHNTVFIELNNPNSATPSFVIPKVGGMDNRGDSIP